MTKIDTNRMRRFKIIDECLRSAQKHWSTKKFQAKFENEGLSASRRTVLRDIDLMCNDSALGYHACIAYCTWNRGYYYTDPSYSIEKIILSKSEDHVLQFADEVTSQYQEFKMTDEVSETVARLTNKRVKKQKKTILFEQPTDYQGTRYLDQLFKLATNQQVITVVYQKFKKPIERTTHVFHLYGLLPYNKLWYAVGYSEKRGGIICLGLDRIKSIEKAHIPYRPNTTIDFTEYFANTIGVTRTDGPIETVSLLFTPEQAEYIKARAFHPTQKVIKDDEEGLTVTTKLRPNYELEEKLLAFGHQVEVIAPPALRESVANKLCMAVAKYGFKVTKV